MTNLLSSHWRIVPRPNISAFPSDARCAGNTGTAVRFLFPKRLQAAQHREKKELYDAIYQREKERALQAAGQEARERFSQCPICRRLVCDSCFLICDEMDLCRECAARMKEPGEPVAP